MQASEDRHKVCLLRCHMWRCMRALTICLLRCPVTRPFKMEDLTEDELNEPMSHLDKARLSSDIKLLPQDKINRVLQIIAEAVPVAKLANENDEVELDINAFDTRCLRMLEGYVRVSSRVAAATLPLQC